MNMIEKVARALALHYEKAAGYREQTDANWQMEYKAAKAAIEAMREPTGKMCWVRSKGYKEMIDAALKE
jgi:hypothetical protein